MEQGLTQPAPMEINPKERNKTACWDKVAELQISKNDANPYHTFKYCYIKRL